MSTSIDNAISEQLHVHSPEAVKLVVAGYERMRKYLSRAIGTGRFPNDTPTKVAVTNDRYMPWLLNANDFVSFCLAERTDSAGEVVGALMAILEQDCNVKNARVFITQDPEDGQTVATFW